MKEIELYKPMMIWLNQYMKDKYNGWKIFTVDSHAERLDRVLNKFDIILDLAIGVDIQVDVLGIAIRGKMVRLVFIEAKVTQLTLRDLGQLWAYCKLIDPFEAFLFTSNNLGSLDKLLNTYKREDLLDFGDIKKIKKMTVGIWDVKRSAPDMLAVIPKI